MKKKAQVYLLDIEQPSKLVLSTSKYGGLFKSEHYSPMKQMGDSYKELYFTSDEEIKVGNWVLNEKGTPQVQMSNDFVMQDRRDYGWRKIVATTDPNLWSKTPIEGTEGHFLNIPIPRIGDDFVEAYIKAYNEGKPITEVNLEYVYSEDNGLYYNSLSEQVLKLRSNGTVIISPVVEKMYTKDEVLVILKCFASDCESDEDLICYEGLDNKGFKKFTYLENWFEQSYP